MAQNTLHHGRLVPTASPRRLGHRMAHHARHRDGPRRKKASQPILARMPKPKRDERTRHGIGRAAGGWDGRRFSF